MPLLQIASLSRSHEAELATLRDEMGLLQAVGAARGERQAAQQLLTDVREEARRQPSDEGRAASAEISRLSNTIAQLQTRLTSTEADASLANNYHRVAMDEQARQHEELVAAKERAITELDAEVVRLRSQLEMADAARQVDKAVGEINAAAAVQQERDELASLRRALTTVQRELTIATEALASKQSRLGRWQCCIPIEPRRPFNGPALLQKGSSHHRGAPCAPSLRRERKIPGGGDLGAGGGGGGHAEGDATSGCDRTRQPRGERACVGLGGLRVLRSGRSPVTDSASTWPCCRLTRSLPPFHTPPGMANAASHRLRTVRAELATAETALEHAINQRSTAEAELAEDRHAGARLAEDNARADQRVDQVQASLAKLQELRDGAQRRLDVLEAERVCRGARFPLGARGGCWLLRVGRRC